MQTLSKFTKLSEGTKEAKADIREQMEQLETYKQEQRRVYFQQQRNTTKRDRERLAQLYILGQQLSMMVKKLKGKLAESKTLAEPDENSEKMWQGEQRAVEKLEEAFHSHSISLMSEEASNLAIQGQLTMELEKVSNLKANVTALYQEGERLCTGRISNKGNYGKEYF